MYMGEYRGCTDCYAYDGLVMRNNGVLGILQTSLCNVYLTESEDCISWIPASIRNQLFKLIPSYRKYIYHETSFLVHRTYPNVIYFCDC